MAYDGVILNNYYTNPLCTPSRSALMTGLYPIHTGKCKQCIHYIFTVLLRPLRFFHVIYVFSRYLRFFTVFTFFHGFYVFSRFLRFFHVMYVFVGMQHGVIQIAEDRGIPSQYKLLPEYLKDLGYTTHAVGKWHLGHSRSLFLPQNRGFDTHYGYWGGYQDYFDHTVYKDGVRDLDFKFVVLHCFYKYFSFAY